MIATLAAMTIGVGLPGPAGAAAGWSAVPSANLSGIAQQSLRSVSCVSPTFCVAVGSYSPDSSSGSRMLIEMWNGASWSIPPGSGAAGELTGVSCVSPSFCMAVGRAGPFSFSGTASWDGTAWTVKDTSLLIDFEPQGVSCGSAMRCTAVGTSRLNRAAIAEGGGSPWNWGVNYEPSTGPESHLEGVSCPSDTSCTAVGWTTDGTTKHTLAGSYTGSSAFFTVATTVDLSNSDSMLHGVSCVSVKWCAAVGETVQVATPAYTSQSSPVVQTWDGKRWLPNPVQPSLLNNGDFLTSVSCTSPSSCTAVGYSLRGSSLVPGSTLVVHWNGLAWTIQTSPNPGAGVTDGPYLRGVSCGAPTRCTAVGDYYVPGKSLGLIDMSNGSAWWIASHPQQPATVDVLQAVSCAASDRCFAVGSFVGSDGGSHSLIESWDGTAWSAAPASGSGMNSVSCVSTDMCMAVGYGAIESWNGNSWSDVPDPTPLGGRLFGVSCASPTMCVAVGGGYLTEMWNGSAWSVVSSPHSGSYANLRSVSCSSAQSCVAVGDFSATSGTYTPRTLVEAWDGANWTVVPSPNPGSLQDGLNSVSCVSPGACTAVGYSSSTRPQPLIEAWDGTSWTAASTSFAGSLGGVSCAAADSCTAVGWDGGTGSLVVSGGSSGWSVVPSANPGEQNSLAAVTCDASNACTAAGRSQTNGDTFSLVERSS